MLCEREGEIFCRNCYGKNPYKLAFISYLSSVYLSCVVSYFHISPGKNYGPKGVGFGITANIEAS